MMARWVLVVGDTRGAKKDAHAASRRSSLAGPAHRRTQTSFEFRSAPVLRDAAAGSFVVALWPTIASRQLMEIHHHRMCARLPRKGLSLFGAHQTPLNDVFRRFIICE
jgi:hypothetical protein